MFTPQNGILRFHMCKMVLSPPQNEILRFHVCKNGILMVFFPTPKWYFLSLCVSSRQGYLSKTYLKILGYLPKNLKISTQVLSHAVPHWLAPYLTATPLEPKAEQHTHTQAPSGSGRVSVSQILQASSPYAPLLLRGRGQKDG